MGESQRANMMGQRVFIIALMASLCVALPTTDLVVPEAKDAGTSGAEFVQSTLKSGGTETQCRTFATDTISSINSGVTSEQGVLAAIDTGSGCAQEGQSGVATATTNKANADADVVTKTQAVTDATATQATACNAPVTMVVNLPTLTANTCYGYTQEADFLSVQGACDAANTALSQANSALGVAQTAATDAQTALDAAVAEAARLMSECHCRVQQEQAAAWTAAGTATASHVADWKQAHEVLCALDQTTTCTVPTCPAVTQPALAAGVTDEDCSTSAPTDAPTDAPTTDAPTDAPTNAPTDEPVPPEPPVAALPMNDECSYTPAKESTPFSVASGVTSLITQLKVGYRNVYVGLDATADIDLVLQNANSEAVIVAYAFHNQRYQTRWGAAHGAGSFAYEGMNMRSCTDGCHASFQTPAFHDGNTYTVSATSSRSNEFIYIDEVTETLNLYVNGHASGSGTVSYVFDCAADCTTCTPT